jgi:hypothetical protein
VDLPDLSPVTKRLLSLVEPHQIRRALLGLATVVEASFDQDGSRITQDEVKRRLYLAADLFCELRRDVKWSVERILNELPNALRSKLDGTPWSPNAHALWKPGDAPPVGVAHHLARA